MRRQNLRRQKFAGRYDLTNGDYIIVQWYEVMGAYYVFANSGKQFISTSRQLRRLLKEYGV